MWSVMWCTSESQLQIIASHSDKIRHNFVIVKKKIFLICSKAEKAESLKSVSGSSLVEVSNPWPSGSILTL